MGCKILGTGSCLPSTILTNTELATQYNLETSDAWIQERTGICRRHIIGPGETTDTLATRAAQRALQAAQLDASQLDMIICATTTPTYTFPSVAILVHKALGCRPIPAFDIQAVCAGFPYALTLAHHALLAGSARTVMVIGAETMSALLDWTDRRTCVLFGDGAGALIIQTQEGGGAADDSGILATYTCADGTHWDKLYTSGGPSSSRTCGTILMNGSEVFKHAVEAMSTSMTHLLNQANIPLQSVDWFVPHQANKRILDAVCKRMGIDPQKMVSTIAQHANTSSASIPLALDTYVQRKLIQPGQLVLFTAMGAGFTWGCVLIRW